MNTSKTQLTFLRSQTTLFFALTALFSLGINAAQALEIKNGKWGITTEVIAPMVTEPIVDYTEECMEGNFDPVAELFEEEIEGCEVLNISDTDSLLEMTMECTIPNAGTMKGEMLFEVFDETAAGKMDMAMDVGGMTMNMSSTWSGEYLGACTP